MRYRLGRVSPAIAILLALGAVAAGVWVQAQLRGSLPILTGDLKLEGLSAPVIVTRDALGIPTVRGASREDVARATGFLHAQDRFFQMDLARRRASGELAALVGARALVADRQIRMHRFRTQAQRAVAAMDPAWQSILNAYTAGVNSGLSQLRTPPFEYALLRQVPRKWLIEDSMLVVLSMFITLQDPDGAYEATLGTMHDVLPEGMANFLAPMGTEWDSPILGSALDVPPIPGPEVYNLRAKLRERTPRRFPAPKPLSPRLRPIEQEARRGHESSGASWAWGLGNWNLGVGDWDSGVDRDGAIGSNNWAVSGRLTTDGRALIANDMHLTVRVPNTWYRAALQWQDGPNATPHRLIGVTLPGVPAIVVGSNTHVAWGFTNSQGDWSDIVLVELDPSDSNRYRTPQGWRAFDRYEETIEVAGEEPRHHSIRWTIWGPVMDPDHKGRLRALRWVAHDATRLGTSISALESAGSIEEAFDAVNGLGAPGQNFVVADERGRIGWTIYGSIARRVGFDGRVPMSWADGVRGWSGWLTREEYPRVMDPENGRIWTANARVVDGTMLASIGDGNYEVGSRARIIRERLTSRERFTAADLLDIQLDTNAEFLSRWRTLLLQALKNVTDQPRIRLREIVERDWDGHASAGSAGYRLTRMFREEVSEAVIAFVLVECNDADPAFDYRNVRRREGPLWKLVTEKPMHLLDPHYSSWDDLLLRAATEVVVRAEREGGLAEPWSTWNVTAYRHPLSGGLPLVGRWLDMPLQPLPGDLYTPNMHWNASASSERMIVSPGHEGDGIMHMPTGQSGNPLSPFYSNSHQAWVNGEATPFLPGPTVYTLTLMP
jgi:penicillin G amidase